MTFEDMYEKCFKGIYKYCYYRNGRDKYYAEEAAKKTFDVMYRKWETVSTYEPKQLISWLYRVAENKLKEVRREQACLTEPLDEQWCRDLVEQQQYQHGEPIDEKEEHERFLQLTEQIERTLHSKDRELFHCRVVDKMPHQQIAQRMGLSENAVKLRWRRLQERLKPLVKKLIDCK